MAYKQMANVYDRFMADAPYDQWVQFTLDIIKNRNVNRIADLGCGTGEITIRLANHGFEMMGIDYSEEMLAIAQQKAFEQQLEVNWLQQDLTTLDGLTDIDLAISYCDVINYIVDEEQVKEVLERTYKSLNSNGLFLFDVHSIDYVEQYYKNQTFAEVLDDMSYIWFCSEGTESGEMYHDLTFFMKVKDGTYRRFDEFHHQRTFPIAFYQQLLKEVGFKNIEVYADFSIELDQIDEKSQRIFFVAEKT